MDNEMITLTIIGAEIKPVITLPSSSPIRQLKRLIMEHTGVPVERQHLLYDNIRLTEDSLIINHHIHEATAEVFMSVVLFPEDRITNITVSNEYCKVDLIVDKVNKVIELKKTIGEVFAIPANDIDLWHMNTKMKDDKMLYRYYIDEGSDVKFTRVGNNS
ncbi:hypothetical protein LWI29_003158 [Acer saccharum]|uniref:Ubiquitin-like domain-containing protein n=1 Tax=Acer saccharum TaxID=4024 RepID=A0AA39S5R6_ACESA|nr:hypothetical protein LWI29_003158 [Acer saccharum]